MLATSRLVRSRIPETGHPTTANVRWASYAFWYGIDPVLRQHHLYYRCKVRLDRFLEHNSAIVNTAFGAVIGVTIYFGLVRVLLPPAVGANEHSMKDNARAVLHLMECDTSKELPAYQLMRVKREIIGKLHAAVDEAEVRQQREQVARLDAFIKGVKGPVEEERAVA